LNIRAGLRLRWEQLKMMKSLIARWNGFTKGQKKTVWLATLIIPVFPVLLEIVMRLMKPGLVPMFSFGEIYIYSFLGGILPIIVLSVMAKFIKVK
jgi:hypothetical protein